MRRAILLLLLACVACAAPVELTVQAPATLADEPVQGERAPVTRIVDGDTIEVSLGGVIEDVRLLGIDTPESVKPDSPIECFGREASAAAEAFLAGREVTLVRDVEDRDRFGRLLRYVYVGEEMANARLVVNGYATAYTYPPNVRHAELFVQLERAAREGDRGLWAEDTCAGEA
jgi:micrococcal nuclease